MYIILINIPTVNGIMKNAAKLDLATFSYFRSYFATSLDDGRITSTSECGRGIT